MPFYHDALYDPRRWNRSVPASFARISPLYHHFYEAMQRDPEVLALLALIDTDQPTYVLFFSLVNFLGLRALQHPLAEFYPYFSAHPRPASEAYPIFRAFCMNHAEELRALLPWVRLQTNEVTRCANLLPAFELVSRWTGRNPLALIEVGASAGLNLQWDRYGYHYGNIVVGDQKSPVQISCTLKGPYLPPFPAVMPVIAQRVGIDLSPISLANERDADWLMACIWPEEIGRYHLLSAAIDIVRLHPVSLLAGDACELLPAVLDSIVPEATIYLWHSYALAQGPAPIYQQIVQMLTDYSHQRDLYRISLEMDPACWEQPRLEVFAYQGGRLARYEWLANCEVHGERMQWLLPPAIER